ncbi:hypothetical protein GBA52_007859 [Prunus armeniaca]|nr:hypothetical protein GBA52_007859 [Prunus armeniaca]
MVSPKDIPHEILFDIIAKLPVKSLLKFRCVCKSWHALISSPSFISAHLERTAMKSGCGYLLMHSGNPDSLSGFCPETYAKCLDLDLPTHRSGSSFYVYGSCNGLLCISDTTKETIYLWNPSIRKFKRLPRGLIRVKYRYSDVATIALGFGLDVGGNDYKVVRVGDFLHGVCVEVYSLRLDSWRIIHAVPPVTEIFKVFWSNKWTYLNGVVYWIVQEFFPDCRYIISFDMENEIFQRIMLPDRLLAVTDSISIRVLEKSLSLFHRRQESDRGYHYYYDIWVLEMDSWKMIRTIPVPAEGKIAWPLAFTANGGVHFTTYGNWQHRKLELYDPKSEQVTDTGIKLGNYGGTRRRIYGYSESLILLN